MVPYTVVTTLERLRIERGLSRYQVAARVPVNRKTLKRRQAARRRADRGAALDP
jgi:hypothetical protein